MIGLITCGIHPINTPTKNLKNNIQPNLDEKAESSPYQNRKNVAEIRAVRRPNLSAKFPHNGDPIAIPKGSK